MRLRKVSLGRQDSLERFALLSKTKSEGGKEKRAIGSQTHIRYLVATATKVLVES